MANHASAILRFVLEMRTEFWGFVGLFPELCKGLSYCCVPEIIPLMELPGVKVARAKQLFNSGLKDVKAVAKAKDTELMSVIDKLTQWQARNMIQAAKHLLKSRADELEEEVTQMTMIVTAPST